MSYFNKKIKGNRGMTYVELIVVLGIFSVLSSVVIYNYGLFQDKIDMKNLSSDIALKVVEAQKSALSGKLNQAASSTWKPAYGLYFDVNTPTQFVYFADLDNSGGCSTPVGCSWPYSVSGEVQEVVNITKGNSLSAVLVTGPGDCSSVTGFSVAFTRPDSVARMGGNVAGCTSEVTYAEITLLSTKGATAKVKLYASGRIQVN